MQPDKIETLASEVWKAAIALRGKFKAKDYPSIILPMIMIRRIECVIMAENLDSTTSEIYNTTNWNLANLLENEAQLENNFVNYLNGFSENIVQIIEKFDYFAITKKVSKEKRLFPLIELMKNQDFSPRRLSNLEMGYIYENLIQKFSEDDAKDTGEHFTPREIIKIMVDLMQMQDIPKNKAISIYDPACGTGGMLSVAKEYLLENGKNSASVMLYGQELLAQNYAICAADMLIKGDDIYNIKNGNSLIPHNESITDDGDQLAGEKFDYMLSNPPFGVSWGGYKKDAAKFTTRYKWGKVSEKIGSIPSSDGALLFLLTMLDKVKTNADGGSKIAILFNGSPLSNGDAGGGESEVRKQILANDLLDTIVMLPDQMFFNTGIYTYIWLLNTNKPAKKKDKVLIINAREHYEKEAKSFGNKRNKITDEHRKWITQTFVNYQATKESKLFHTTDFYYHKVKIVFWQQDENGKGKWIDETVNKLSNAVAKKLFNKYGDFTITIGGITTTFDNNTTLEKLLTQTLGKTSAEIKTLLITEEIIINRREYIDDIEYIPYQDGKSPDEYIPEFLKAELTSPIITWTDEGVGAEFLPNKYFYHYQAPTLTTQIMQNIQKLETQVQELLQEIESN